ncbi:MAG: SGNH/GDSL hydrolase family protein [Candidatus Nanopelagicales bacterium]|nr:SGNH/GDSL hydrolase family protein [Candidatus Nanopelagicales bacterium]
MISAGDADPGSVLILGDSLAFHGPDGAYRPTDPRLFGTRVGQGLGKTVDLVARPGWTTRDIWWALTKDPVVWGVYLPRASHVLLAVGGMDALPAAAPTWVRESISFIRPGALRRRVRSAFLRASPVVIKTSSGRLRQLPQHATDHYLSRIVSGIRTFRPNVAIATLTPAPYRSALYPSAAPHASAVAAMHAWAREAKVDVIDLEPLSAHFAHNAPPANPDGLHWSWPMHEQVAEDILALWVDPLNEQPLNATRFD